MELPTLRLDATQVLDFHFHEVAVNTSHGMVGATHQFARFNLALTLNPASRLALLRMARSLERAERAERRMRGYHPADRPVPFKANARRYGRG